MSEQETTRLQRPGYSLWQMVQYMAKLGTIGFGGPVALVGYMHRDLVEHRRWISEADYKEGLTLAQLMPGPLAAQLGIYLGYVHYGVIGATLAGARSLARHAPSMPASYAPRCGVGDQGGRHAVPAAIRHRDWAVRLKRGG